MQETQTQCDPTREGVEMKTQEEAENGEKESVNNKRKPSVKAQRYGQIFLAEYVATTILLFLVCLGCINGSSTSPLSPLQSPFASGLAVASLVACFGHITGAHMNPAVTACFWTLGKIDIPTFFVYFVAEILGAVTGVGLLRALVPGTVLAGNPGYCETTIHPHMSTVAAAVFEFLITSLLIYLVCSLADKRNSANQDSGAIKFGLAVVGLCLAGGNITGSSLNPVRTFAPALWSGHWDGHWAYWVGPMSAGFVVPMVYKFLFMKDFTENANQ